MQTARRQAVPLREVHCSINQRMWPAVPVARLSRFSRRTTVLFGIFLITISLHLILSSPYLCVARHRLLSASLRVGAGGLKIQQRSFGFAHLRALCAHCSFLKIIASFPIDVPPPPLFLSLSRFILFEFSIVNAVLSINLLFPHMRYAPKSIIHDFFILAAPNCIRYAVRISITHWI